MADTLIDRQNKVVAETGEEIGIDYALYKRDLNSIETGAAPFVLFIDGKFFSHHVSRRDAYDEIENTQQRRNT